ncbi:MAG: hypothetical protein ABIF82_12505 [Planctomycetota bacterium]
MRRFLFRLALALGKTVDQLGREMTSRELVEWMAFDSIEPFGAWRDDFRIAHALTSVYGGRPIDYMPLKEDREQTLEEQEQVMQVIAKTVKPEGA